MHKQSIILTLHTKSKQEAYLKEHQRTLNQFSKGEVDFLVNQSKKHGRILYTKILRLHKQQ